MKKIIMAAIVLFSGVTASYAQGSSPIANSYASIGYVFGNTQMKQRAGKTDVYEPSFNLGIGTSLTATESDIGSLRATAEWTYRAFEQDDNFGATTDVLINTFGANAYFDFKTGTIITPYVNVMVGVTYAHLELGPGFDKSKLNLAYGFGLGTAVKINDKTSIDLEYKRSEMLNKVGGFKIKHSDILLGLRLYF